MEAAASPPPAEPASEEVSFSEAAAPSAEPVVIADASESGSTASASAPEAAPSVAVETAAPPAAVVAPAAAPATASLEEALPTEGSFRMDADESSEESPPAAPGFTSPGGTHHGADEGGGSAVRVPPGGDVAQDVRRRFKFLSVQDQKTTVRRECHNASKREEALLAQMQRHIAAYGEALELNKVCEKLPDGAGPVLAPEEVAKYEERVKFLRGTIALLEEEPTVSLPKLTALEHSKGIAFSGYAWTASRVKDMGDETGVSEPVVAAANNVLGAVTSFTRRFSGSVDASTIPPASSDTDATAPHSQNPMSNLDDFVEAPLLSQEPASSASGPAPS